MSRMSCSLFTPLTPYVHNAVHICAAINNRHDFYAAHLPKLVTHRAIADDDVRLTFMEDSMTYERSRAAQGWQY